MAKITEALVSTIIPVFNRPSLLPEAVHSVLSQDHANVEVIIVDDGSTDETLSVARALEENNPGKIRVTSKENSGPGPSRQFGLDTAKGDYVQFLDSDDLLVDGKFSAQVALLHANPGYALCYGITQYYRLGEEYNSSVFGQTDQEISSIFPTFLVRRLWGTSTPLYRKSVLDEVGPWGDMWAEEDWEYDCRIGATGRPVGYVDQVVSIQRGLVGQRLSQQGRDDVRTLKSQAKARKLIYQHARKAGISAEATESEIFVRHLFRLARDCGGAGLDAQALELSAIAIEFAANSKLCNQIRSYRRLSALFGWKAASRSARALERLALLGH